MAITLLRIADFRNLSAVILAPCEQGLNIIYGNNGSGKTSLLEAIHYLGVGRSFRSGTSNQLIRHQTTKFVLFANLMNAIDRQIPMGIERELGGVMRLRVAEKESISMAELASFLPTRVINAHSHYLFEGGPLFRRKFLDWGLFYQFDNFLPCWRYFERALKQRNRVLRERRSKQELDSWTTEVVKYGLELTYLRRKYIQLLFPFIVETAQMLLPAIDLQINYHPGWDENEEYAAILADHQQEEYRAGYTSFGPHRADLDIHIEAISVKHFLSRGQQKLLVCAMIVAQGMLLANHTNKRAIYLVDDLPSELDLQGRQKLISLLAKQKTQTFITAIEKETISDWINEPEVLMKVFHVEHGGVRETI